MGMTFRKPGLATEIAEHERALEAFNRSKDWILHELAIHPDGYRVKAMAKPPIPGPVLRHAEPSASNLAIEFHAVDRPGYSFTVYCRDTGTVVYRMERAHFS